MHGGSGLGITIPRHLIIAMNGIINVESEIAVGTKFLVTLPVAISENERN
jgi:signal transduction histidine kinase